MAKTVIRKKSIPNLPIKQLIQQFKLIFPQWMLSPTQIVIIFLTILNKSIIIFCCFLLIGQTARIITQQQKYANLKYLLIKWVVFLLVNSLIQQISDQNIQSQFFKSICLILLLFIVYPSKILKSIIKKYFKPEQFGDQSNRLTDSMIMSNSFMYKFLISMMVFLLKIVKYVLTFIHPDQRRQIQQQIKGVNMVLIEQKYFWKIYDPLIKVPAKEESFVIVNESIEQKKSRKMSTEIVRENKQDIKKSAVKKENNSNKGFEIKQSTLMIKNSVRGEVKKIKKYQVSEYLPLFSAKNRANAYPTANSRRCTYYRQIQISYDVDSALMTITSLEDMKISYHSLEEVILLQDLMVQFQFEDNEQTIVKFKTKNQADEFISEIDMHQSAM